MEWEQNIQLKKTPGSSQFLFLFTKICTDISIYTSENNPYYFPTFPWFPKCTVIEN